MYLQITTRCNMLCNHCGMSCTADGEDMTIKTFRNALDISDGDYITLGGGEPTIHPRFKLFLIEAIASEVEGIHIITNGKHKQNALLLAKLAKKEVISASLSLDWFHDPISEEVENLYRKLDFINDTSNDGNRNPINAGRAKEFYHKDELRDECICEGKFVKPNGDVYLCGCEDSLCIGNVNDKSFNIPYIENEEYQNCECWNKISDESKEEIKTELSEEIMV